MRYACIDRFEYVNGNAIGVSLFVQGCPFHCYNCFNQETWDFSGGEEFTDTEADKIIDLLKRPYIKRLSVLGGEPLADENVSEVLNIIEDVRFMYPDINIWLYTGFTFEKIANDYFESDPDSEDPVPFERYMSVLNADYLVDGRYVDGLRDITLPFRGSNNQRIIDIKKTIKNNEVVYADFS